MKKLTTKIDRRNLTTAAGAGRQAHLGRAFAWRAQMEDDLSWQRRFLADMEGELSPLALGLEWDLLAEKEANLAALSGEIEEALQE